MEILTKLTKTVFEEYVPAAKMPERNDSVYNRLKTQFQLSYDWLVENIIGAGFRDAFEADEEAQKMILHFVAVDAFVRKARSLDLVLTATGFGIVSTESTAPASQQRVDSLLGQLRLEDIETGFAIVAALLPLNGWADSPNAINRVDSLLWNPADVWPGVILPPSFENWVTLQGRIMQAENIVRQKAIGDDCWEYLIDAMRHGTMTTVDHGLASAAIRFTLDYVNRYDETKVYQPINQHLLDGVTKVVEANADALTAYKDSDLYAARHKERYENKREDPTFFFTT